MMGSNGDEERGKTSVFGLENEKREVFYFIRYLAKQVLYCYNEKKWHMLKKKEAYRWFFGMPCPVGRKEGNYE